MMVLTLQCFLPILETFFDVEKYFFYLRYSFYTGDDSKQRMLFAKEQSWIHRDFVQDSDLNFFNQLHFRMHVLNRIPVFAQVTTGKVTASL